MAKPDKIRIPFEDDQDSRFYYVGRYDGDRQFMAYITGAFPDESQFPGPGDDWESIKSWWAVIHRFDADGNHLDSDLRLGGYEAEGEAAQEKVWDEFESLLKEIMAHKPKPGDIYVKLFSVTVNGVTHGLIYESDEDEEESEYVLLEPNDIMFHQPWDSGEYST
jgi:hypothetical protein